MQAFNRDYLVEGFDERRTIFQAMVTGSVAIPFSLAARASSASTKPINVSFERGHDAPLIALDAPRKFSRLDFLSSNPATRAEIKGKLNFKQN